MHNTVKSYFNRAFTTYNHASTLQQQIGKALIKLINKEKITIASIIDLGCGTGHITQLLYKHYPSVHFHAIDIAENLLTLASEYLANLPILLYQANFDEFNLSHSFDLIFSNMAFQWSADLKSLFKKLHSLQTKQGHLAFSLPLIDTFRELPEGSKNTFISFQELKKEIEEAGYQIIQQREQYIELPFLTTREALLSIKQTGANHIKHKRKKGLSKFSAGRLDIKKLTYHIGFILAKAYE